MSFSSSCDLQLVKNFWKAIVIYLKNPHLVNRRLTGSVDLYIGKLIDNSTIDDEIIECFKSDSFESNHLCEISSWNDIKDCLLSNDTEIEQSSFVILQKILSKSKNNESAPVLYILNGGCTSTRFVNLSSEPSSLCPKFNFSIAFSEFNDPFVLKEVEDIEVDNPSLLWLKNILLPRLNKWSIVENNNKQNTIVSDSLKLIDKSEYQIKYNELKLKYGTEMVKIWPENTDPKKFVYEDVAIATYLLILWENQRKTYNLGKKQSFIDLGCGNGLLVYILCSEGHEGKGVDVRKRGIWDLYPEFVNLEVATVSPSDEKLYRGFDWLIGNHSDELSPWVPVFALKNSYHCKYFLLPCCAYEFDGSKYQRKNSTLSQYCEYLKYIEDISVRCGFETQIDRLKIPSTKRICLIGSGHSFPSGEYRSRIEEVNNFVAKICSDGIQTGSWMDNIKTREDHEKVKNCTQIGDDVIQNIIKITVTELLKNKNYIDGWNSGGVISLNDIVKFIPKEDLKRLKSECGGLQTLFRNNHCLFEVNMGSVKLRYPRTRAEIISKRASSNNYKNNRKKAKTSFGTRKCWFYHNHPERCPLPAEDCCYIHN